MAQVDAGDREAVPPGEVDGGGDRAGGRPPAEDEEIAGLIPEHFEVGDVVGDPRHLLGPQVDHGLVVVRVVGDVAGHRLFFEAADPMLQAGGAGDRPGPGEGLRLAQVGMEPLGLGAEVGSRSGRSATSGSFQGSEPLAM